MSLTAARRAYAELVSFTARVRTPGLLEAFATVPREDYLGPGPWAILDPQSLPEKSAYSMTPSADPALVYQDVCVALDRDRGLNNGQPSFLALCIDELMLAPGERVLHVGCGVGYYSAIISEVVGRFGSVVAVEIDPVLAARAKANLAGIPNVVAANADGAALPVDRYDAILVNAGVTALQQVWLESLSPGGRLLIPLTVTMPTSARLTLGLGKLLRVVRNTRGFAARFVSRVGIYHCASARDDATEAALAQSLARKDDGSVRSLRVDRHEPDEHCWLHTGSLCLSLRELDSV